MSEAPWRIAFIGIGSNMASPADQVRAGISLLGTLRDTQLVSRSDLYRSAPLGGMEQEDFVNAVVELKTRLEPHELLQQLKSLEDAQGRDRSVERWGPRVLDLDLLAIDDEIIDYDDLKIPHPGIADRNFVLLPWAEIAPEYRIPALKSVADLAREAPEEPRIEKLD